MKRNILICGAGKGGHALSAYLSLSGERVTLFSTTREKVEKIRRNKNRISVTGIIEGVGQLAAVTNNLEEAVEGAVNLEDPGTARYRNVYENPENRGPA